MIADIFQTELQAGDFVAYAAQGSGSNHGMLRIGKVLQATLVPCPYDSKNPVAKVDLLVACQKEWNDDTLTPRKTTISRIDNVVVIHPDTVPAAYKAVLA